MKQIPLTFVRFGNKTSDSEGNREYEVVGRLPQRCSATLQFWRYDRCNPRRQEDIRLQVILHQNATEGLIQGLRLLLMNVKSMVSNMKYMILVIGQQTSAN